jgi:diguanylate cyclase (GGDEF)-like protein
MSKRVIFLNGEPRAETAWLASLLHEAGFDYKTSPMEEEAEATKEERDENQAEGKRQKAKKSPPVLAVLCAVAEDTDVSELRTLVKRAYTRWPEATLVAYRLVSSEEDDNFKEAGKVESLYSETENSQPKISTLRRLGFTQIADTPEQLPVLLRGLAARDTAPDFPRHNLDLRRSPTSIQLPQTLSMEHMRVAFEFASTLHFAFDEESAAETAIGAFARLIRADVWTICLTTESSSENAPLEVLATTASRTDENVWQISEAARKAALGETTRTDENNRRVLALPLANDEKIVGVIEAVRERARSRRFDDAEVEMLETLAAPLAAAMANVGRAVEAERLSQTDDLTKLHNSRFMRQCLISEIKRARRYGSTVSAVFLDLDDFKEVNDQHGHLAGSQVLVELAAVILQSVRDTDIVARYGGDEFVVILPETGVADARRVAERVRAGIARCEFTGGRENLRLNLTASFGVASFPEHAQSPQQLIIAADTAMYEAKAASKNCVRLAANMANRGTSGD